MPKKVRPYAVICLWEYDAAATERNRWRFVEAYGVDQDGYACTPSKHASGDRHSYTTFISQKVWYDKTTNSWSESPVGDSDDYDWKPIHGRVVTVWTTESGVSLAAFNPPTRVEWLSSQFCAELIKMDKWHQFIEDGYTLYMGTAREVEKLLG